MGTGYMGEDANGDGAIEGGWIENGTCDIYRLVYYKEEGIGV